MKDGDSNEVRKLSWADKCDDIEKVKIFFRNIVLHCFKHNIIGNKTNIAKMPLRDEGHAVKIQIWRGIRFLELVFLLNLSRGFLLEFGLNL